MLENRVELLGLFIKGVRADMVKGRVTIALEGYLDEQMLNAKDFLSTLSQFEQIVDVTIERQQMVLPMKGQMEVMDERDPT